jgi:CheY-like chemotaxis protein
MAVDANDAKQARLMIKKEVLINETIKGHTLEISEGDMFLYSPVPFTMGRIIELSFSLAEGRPPIKLRARVQTAQEGVGVGVSFTGINQVDKERLKKFIEENVPAQLVKQECPAGDTRKKILLVDDSATARATYKNKLVLSNYNVREASSGMEAIKSIAEDIPDLIVLDMQMEGMDGTKLLQFVRSNDTWKNVKVLMLSGRITPQETERISAMGVSGILSKMVTTPNKLAEQVKQILGV